MALEVIRKGPWTDNEDGQLGFYVNLFGDRRWDFIAKVSGLKRTGKSCRLRWVNYLHPGLRRGKMTPHEECLVLELHAKWGNRWSRIARKLPGRTDNEIKNYWRTHMRKKAQEMKQTSSFLSSSSYTSSSSSSSINTMPMDNIIERSFYDNVFTPSSLVSYNSCNSSTDSLPLIETRGTKNYDMGGLEMMIPKIKDDEEGKGEKAISMDDLWQDIEHSESQEHQNHSSEMVFSPIWNFSPDNSLWAAKEENKMHEMVFPPITDHLFPFYGL